MRRLELDDDVVERAERIAQIEGKTVSQVIGDVVRDLLPDLDVRPSWIIDLPPDAPPLDDETAKRLLDEEDADNAARCKAAGEPAA